MNLYDAKTNVHIGLPAGLDDFRGWQRDDGLDFPDSPRDEPTLDEVKDRIAYYETHPYLADESEGFRG